MKNNDTYLIWYHLEDNDGVFSAAIIYNYLVHELNVNKDNITLEGVTYTILNNKYKTKDDFNTLNQFSNIIITDISFNDYNNMIILKEMYNDKLIWIDHHKPIIELSNKCGFADIKGYRGTEYSAIIHAYKYFYNNDNYPCLFKILSAYDSWSWEKYNLDFDYCRNVNKGVTFTYNLNINKVIQLVYELLYTDINSKDIIDEMEKTGKMLNEYDDIQAKNQLDRYADYNWTVNGEKAVMVVFQGPTSSLFFKTLKNTEYKNGIILKYNPSGIWNVSLYNINGDYDKVFHCGKYLNQKYGGGGHAGAAGADLSNEIFNRIMSTKTL